MVHALPGRVRLRVHSADASRGDGFAEQLASHPAVHRTRWSHSTRSLTAWYDASTSFAEVLKAMPPLPAPSGASAEPDRQPLWRQFLVPAVSLAAAFLPLGVLSRLAIAACAVPIVRRATAGVLARRLTIDLLDTIAVGLLLAVGDTLAGGVSVALIETGERVRLRASGRARHVLRSWMGVDTRGIRVLRGASEPRLPIPEVSIGEKAVVYAGEYIPVDGRVTAGAGTVDTRTWTGESMPASIGVGGDVLAGSSLVEGRIVVSVRAIGDETRAGRLAIALEDAIAANTRTYDRARRIADGFVAPAFLAGGIVYAVTGEFARLVSILILDFGTGIRIALPTTMLATMIAGARQGILFKNGQSLENLASVDTVVFDKTGTLTTGSPSVESLTAEDGFSKDVILSLAASAEGHLPHPLARAIRKAAHKQGVPLHEPRTVRHRAGGVAADVLGRRVLVGDARFLADHGVRTGREGPADSSLAMVAIDGRLAGKIYLRDRIKDSAREAVHALRRQGVSSCILATGDHEHAARLVGRQLGVDRLAWGLMPEDKVRMVEELRSQGRVTAVVGDGINDAAAMAVADVGIAVPQGAELTREAAEVVLLSDDLTTLATAFELARNADRIVKENVGLVAAPNAIGLSLASFGGLTPLLATLINNGSTLLAGANSLRPLLHDGRPRRS